jgi:hypothetical protein
VWLAVGGLAVLCLALLAAAVRERRSRVAARAEVADLRARLDDLERDWRTPAPASEAEFVITDLGVETDPQAAPTSSPPIDGPAFADTVLRETVVKAASLAHGVRRGLAPGTRNRIRFEMKQEVRRARRQRRADLKQAQRDLHARQRAMLTEEAEAG